MAKNPLLPQAKLYRQKLGNRGGSYRMPSALSLRVFTQNSWSSAAPRNPTGLVAQLKTTNLVSWASTAPLRAGEGLEDGEQEPPELPDVLPVE